MADKTVAELLVSELANNGVKRIYGLVGDSLNPISDVLRRDGRIDFIHMRHEESAAFAASAEAQLTEKLAVCAGTAGPGNLHLINGLYDAHRSYAPVFAIASQIPQGQIGTGYFQETHPEKIFEECSSYCELLSSEEQLPRVLQIALQTSISQKGVSTLAIPGDISNKSLDPSGLRHNSYHPEPVKVPAEGELSKLADMVNSAKRVTLFCGDGCRHAHKEVIALAEKIKAPIAYTMRGKQWMGADNPYEVGMTGLLGFGGAAAALEKSDLIIILGADFPYPAFIPTSPKIAQVDIRGEHLGKKARVDLGLEGDVKETVAALLAMANEKTDRAHLDAALKDTKKAREDLDVYVNSVACARKPHPEYATSLIDKYAADDAVFTIPTGLGTLWGARYITPKPQRNIIGSFSHGSMANEIPMAIGAQLAYPGREVVAICGDGGFTMLMGELLTVAQYDLPIKMFVYNNGTLGFIDLEMMAAGYVPYKTSMKNPNFAELAKVVGIEGIRINDNCELEAGIKKAFEIKGPVLVDMATNPHAIALPPKISFTQAKNFSLAMSKLVLGGKIDDVLGVLKANEKTLKTLI